MSPAMWALRLIATFENKIIETILRQPGFHRAVGRIHKTIHEQRFGRNPNEPLAPGEATAEPGSSQRPSRFAKHFLDEVRNQFRGKPSDLPHEPPKK